MTEPTRPPEQTPVLAPGHTFASVTEKIAAIVFSRKSMLGWFIASAITLGLVLLLLFAITYLVLTGVGIWGLNVPVGWGLAIVNFVWWIGIGHAGTLISAILLLLRQRWRTSINRFAETMTLFAVMCAGIFPLIHMGRPWLAYWMVPYPNTMDLWPQFRSPLLWDVFAVGTYALVSCMFWYVGLIPDLATLRDRTPSRTGKLVYGVLAMGWRGAAGHWQRYETAYLLLAALAAPLVVSVHTVVSFDFAAGVLPGWHSTIFPPYFVAGALFSGFAMVLTLAIPLRAIYKLQDFITMKHLDNIAKIILATGMFVSFGYLMEGFTAWYSGEPYEQFVFINRFTGPYAGAYWALLFCNVLAPQLLWSKRIRGNVLMLFVIAIIVNVGMWLERFIIVVVSLHRDFLTSSWDMYTPTFWDWATFIGSLGLFLFLLLMFIRVMPMISIYEMRGITPDADMEEGSDGGADD